MQYTIFINTLIFFTLFKINPLFAQGTQTGKSYINVSKGTNGGTFEPGDTLEIHSVISVGSNQAKYVRYNDTIGGNFTYVPNTLKILTNEGLIFRAFTDAPNDDNGMYNAATLSLRINLGIGATAVSSTDTLALSGGTITAGDKPIFSGTCIMVAAFRVIINSSLSVGTTITMPGGAYRYSQSKAKIIPFTPYQIALLKNLGSCNNFIGSNAVIENNGSFGSGTTQNRAASAIVPGYQFIPFSGSSPNDGYYGICNNSSAGGATDNSVPKPDPSRVFSTWEIMGDHTGAANPTLGNPPTSIGQNGGYMLVVNASYSISSAIRQPISGLCTNTYYDFTAWFRNLCQKCSTDSNGNQANNQGVTPNLTYQIDGIDYYTTGDINYTGLWTKKGFTFFTGLTQTSFTLTIRNNSPGGGGNDWALDDVNLATCEPNVDLNITPITKVCPEAQIDFNVTVKSYFPNYTFYKWQKSLDGGNTWLDTGVGGTRTPILTNGQWVYNASYPTFLAHYSDSGSRYRVVAATDSANLANTACAYSNSKSTEIKVQDCAKLLQTTITNFCAHINNKKANLQWISTKENNFSHYEIEKSTNGKNFYKIGIVKRRDNNNTATYGIIDPEDIAVDVYYRLKIVDIEGLFIYSNVLLLSNKTIEFSVISVVNPFGNDMAISYILPSAGSVEFFITDAIGKVVKKQVVVGRRNINDSKLGGLNTLSEGIYTISIIYQNQRITKRVIKL